MLTTLTNFQSQQFTFSYDGLSRRTQMTRPNGVNTNYAYDNLSRLLSVLHQVGGNTIDGATYTVDAVGNRTSQNGTAGGAPSMQTVVNTSTNRVTQMGGVNVQHDASGNLTQDDINTYNYDGENRMIQSPPSSPFPNLFNTYDGAGLRVKRVSNGGSSTTRVIFSGSKEIAHYVNSTAPGSPTYEFIYAGSQLIAVTGGTAQAPWQRYLHQDHLSPRVITNETGGLARVSGHYPFGEMWYEQLGGTPLKFTTYHRDPETGLDYAMFRWNSPRLGRFMTTDPFAGTLLNPQSLNRYAYVMNDPIGRIDPLGLFIKCVPWNCSNAYFGPMRPWFYAVNTEDGTSTKCQLLCIDFSLLPSFLLSDCVKGILQQYFPGVDLDDITVYSVPGLDELDIAGYTVDEDTILIDSDNYSQETTEGISLIGHEVTHVEQFGSVESFPAWYVQASIPGLMLGLSFGDSLTDALNQAYESNAFEKKAGAKEEQIRNDLLRQGYGLDKDPCP